MWVYLLYNTIEYEYECMRIMNLIRPARDVSTAITLSDLASRVQRCYEYVYVYAIAACVIVCRKYAYACDAIVLWAEHASNNAPRFRCGGNKKENM